MHNARISILDKNGDVESSMLGVVKMLPLGVDDSFILELVPVAYACEKSSIRNFVYRMQKMFKRHKKVLPDYKPQRYVFDI